MKQVFKLTSYTVDFANHIPTLRLWLEYNNKEYYALYDKHSYSEFEKLPALDKGNYYNITYELYNNNKDYQSVVGMYVSKIEQCTDIDNYDNTYDTAIQALILHINNYCKYIASNHNGRNTVAHKNRCSKLTNKILALSILTGKDYHINTDEDCIEEAK